MSNKRYYWLKLNENFFDEDTIIFLEEQENGKDYIIFYLKLLLKSIRDEGKLVRFIGNKIVPYDVKSLAKLTNVSVDTVAVAMKLFEEFGLVKKLNTGELYLSQIKELIGSETEGARRVRRHRAIKQQEQALLQCNDDVIICNDHIEIDKELDEDIDKEIDTKETMFNEFWELYPRKINKKKSRTAYERISKVNHDLIIEDLTERVQTEEWLKDNGKFIPHPTTYLNGERWFDEMGTKPQFKPKGVLNNEVTGDPDIFT